MIRKSIKGVFSPSMKATSQEPVIENNRLPSMDEKEANGAKSKSSSKGQLLMDNLKKDKKTVVTKKDIASGKVMAPFSTASQKTKAQTVNKPGDQVEKRTRPGSDGSYVVFRMRVQNGVIGVVGSKKVNSKLEQNETLLRGGLTYEATLNDALISLGSIADFGERRSYPRPGEHEHHITNVPSFDFNVKIPSDKIVLKDLPKLKVSLVRLKESVEGPLLSNTPLKAQFENEVRVVAQLDGIKLNRLNKDVKELVKKAVGK